jgi:hypothetical protein
MEKYRPVKVKKLVEIVLKISIGMFALSFAALVLFGTWLTERPREPRPETGQVVPFNVHGTTYYISERDDRVFYLARAAVAVSLTVFVVVMIARNKVGPE